MELLSSDWASLLYIKFCRIVRILALLMRFILELLRKDFEMKAPTIAREIAAEYISREKLMEDMGALVADTEELLKAIANPNGVRFAVARTKVGESLQIAKEHMAEARVAGIGYVETPCKTSGDDMQTNPCQPMDIVAALGLALGVLNSRRDLHSH